MENSSKAMIRVERLSIKIVKMLRRAENLVNLKIPLKKLKNNHHLLSIKNQNNKTNPHKNPRLRPEYTLTHRNQQVSTLQHKKSHYPITMHAYNNDKNNCF